MWRPAIDVKGGMCAVYCICNMYVRLGSGEMVMFSIIHCVRLALAENDTKDEQKTKTGERERMIWYTDDKHWKCECVDSSTFDIIDWHLCSLLTLSAFSAIIIIKERKKKNAAYGKRDVSNQSNKNFFDFFFFLFAASNFTIWFFWLFLANRLLFLILAGDIYYFIRSLVRSFLHWADIHTHTHTLWSGSRVDNDNFIAATCSHFMFDSVFLWPAQFTLACVCVCAMKQK